MVEVIRVANRESRGVKSYRDLLVWQKSMELVTDLYKAVTDFPREELYGLTSQIRRCVVSIPSNIAEGSSRRSTPEFLRFINIATGSLAEFETQLEIATRLDFVTEAIARKLREQADEISRMLQGLYDALERKLR